MAPRRKTFTIITPLKVLKISLTSLA